MKVHIIMREDLVIYPPLQSLILVLRDLGNEIAFIGDCSDISRKKYFEDEGVSFIPVVYRPQANLLKTYKEQQKYRIKLRRYLNEEYDRNNDIIWFVYFDMAYFVHDILRKTNYVIHFYEFINVKMSWKFELMYPSYNFADFVRSAKAVIHCEYNRAHITRGLCGLKDLPFVLPNKPYPDNNINNIVPNEVREIVEDVKNKITNKKVLLYQGIFESNERRLEEFCEAALLLPDDYVLVTMGGGSKYYADLKKRFESDKILFVPFIKSPNHLLITKLAHIGVLSYFPLNPSYAGVLNPLYCAPNKIFEYSKFGIPMISNDLPGLKTMYEKYNCGKIVPYPITPESIKNVVLDIFNDWKDYSHGSKTFYKAVNVKEIVANILKNLTLSR